MSNIEILAIKGKIQVLKEQERKVCVKIEGASELIRRNCSTVLHDSYDQMDDNIIEIYSEELVKSIRELREIKEKIKKAQKQL